MRKRKRKAFGGGFNIPLEIIIGSAGGLLMLLVLTHFVLIFVSIGKVGKQKILKAEWEKILPDKEKVDTIITDLRLSQKRIGEIRPLADRGDLSWSEKLNIVSDSLPRGVWLKKIALMENVLFVEGSAISRQKKEMISVHNFATNLKEKEDFVKHFDDLEISSIERRTIKKIEIADFLITATLP